MVVVKIIAIKFIAIVVIIHSLFYVLIISLFNFGKLKICGFGRMSPDAERRIPAFAKPAKAPKKIHWVQNP